MIVPVLLSLCVSAGIAGPLGATTSVRGTSMSGITYNPYRTTRQCSTEQLIDEDLRIIATYAGAIRTYATECGHDRWIFKSAAKYGLDLTIGLWVNEYSATFDGQLGNLMAVLADSATTALEKSMLKAVVVGNEALYRKEVSVAVLAAHIATARQQLAAVGLPSVRITTSDIPSMFESTDLVAAVDFLLPNLHVFFEGIDIAETPAQLWARFEHLQHLANGKQVVIGETGWPSAGLPFSKDSRSLPSPANAQYLLNTFLCEANRRKLDYFYFDAFNADWKYSATEHDEEYHWGIMTSARQVKNYTLAAFECTEQSYAWTAIQSCNDAPYDPKVYSCTAGTLLCPLPLVGCGVLGNFACFNPKDLGCVHGALVPLSQVPTLPQTPVTNLPKPSKTTVVVTATNNVPVSLPTPDSEEDGRVRAPPRHNH